MTTTGRAYGGVSAEQRQAERRERLVEAALELIGAEGTSAITVNRLCREANLNERYFYESFRDRDEVLEAVASDTGLRVVAALVSALAEAEPDARSQAYAAIGAGVDLLAEDPRLAALLLESTSHPVLAPLRIELTQALVGLIAERGLATLNLEHSPEVEKDATFAATMLLGGLIESFSAWARGQLRLERDELVERSVEMFLLVGDHAARTFGRGD